MEEYVYVCVCSSVLVCVCVHLWVCVCGVYVNNKTLFSNFIFFKYNELKHNSCVCVYVHMGVRVCVCVCARAHERMCVRTYKCMRM